MPHQMQKAPAPAQVDRENEKGGDGGATDEPLSKNAVAKARSFFENHSQTAFVAAGQLADSPAPKIGHTERYHDVCIIAARPVVLQLRARRQQQDRLAIDITDNSGGKQNSANPPA
jgi:hypothetical protein